MNNPLSDKLRASAVLSFPMIAGFLDSPPWQRRGGASAPGWFGMSADQAERLLIAVAREAVQEPLSHGERTASEDAHPASTLRRRVGEMVLNALPSDAVIEGTVPGHIGT